MTDDELLSRLLDAELDAEATTALHARIEQEPSLRARYEALCQIVGDLDELVEPVPPALDAAVLAESPVETGRVRWAPLIAVAAAAVLALLWWGSASTPAEVRLLAGTQRVEGQVHALAGTLPIEVDGIAVITVEPGGGVDREWGALEDPMPKTAILSALAGAAVTVVVYEGRARILDPGTEAPVIVEAGDTYRAPGRTRTVRIDSPSRIDRSGPPEAVIPALEAENQALREQLKEAQFAGAVAKGQLAAHQGKPTEWPADVLPGLEPEAFESGLNKVLADHPEMELVDIDCGEFPCVAVLTGPAGQEGWEKDMQEVPRVFAESTFPDDDVGMEMMVAGTDDGGEMRGAVGFSLTPEGPGIDPEVGTRTQHRTRELLDSFIEP